MGRLEITQSNCLCCIIGVKLTDRNRLDYTRTIWHVLATLDEIRAATAERACDRQAWQGAIENLALLEFKKPQQVGGMTRSCARRGGSG
eukprot:365796-Chlamydomonas_euryale.AAC.18